MVRSAVNLASKFSQNNNLLTQSKLGSCSGNSGVGGFTVVVFQIVEREVTLICPEGFGMATGS